MKKFLLMTMMLVFGLSFVQAQTDAQGEGKPQAEIKFDKKVHDYGQFAETDGPQACTFTFTNIGDAPLIINQAVASCGCTVPEYTKEPIMPGKSGELKVTYNGAGKFPGQFKKSITVRTNGKIEMTRLYVSGNMSAAKK